MFKQEETGFLWKTGVSLGTESIRNRVCALGFLENGRSFTGKLPVENSDFEILKSIATRGI